MAKGDKLHCQFGCEFIDDGNPKVKENHWLNDCPKNTARKKVVSK